MIHSDLTYYFKNFKVIVNVINYHTIIKKHGKLVHTFNNKKILN